MKKLFLILFLSAFASSGAFATHFVKITRITGSVQIKTPDGEVAIYKNLNSIPEFVYGSRVLASGGTAEIKIFNTASVTLEKNQEILIAKHPVTKEIEVSKVEPKNKKPRHSMIKAWLADYASASFGSDTKVTFLEDFPSILFKVSRGEARLSGLGGRVYTLAAGEYYEAKQNITQ